MKLYYFLEEASLRSHVSHWAAFEELKGAGYLEDFEVCSFRFLEKTFCWADVLDQATTRILDFRPDVIVISHPQHRRFPKSFFGLIRSKNPKVRFILDERDVHGILAKPLPINTIRTARMCDTVFLVAQGVYANFYRLGGCEDVRYLPHVTDNVRFGRVYDIAVGEDYKVALIGNLSNTKLIKMPGTNKRFKLVQAFTRYFGRDFAVFGNGWKGLESWRGPCLYGEQELIIQKALCSVGMDHFPAYHNYFSDRLPIALYSGRPHITYNTPGVAEQFIGVPSIFFFDNISEAILIARRIIDNGLYLPSNETRKVIEANYLERGRLLRMLQS